MNILYLLFYLAILGAVSYIAAEWGASRERNRIYDQIIHDEYYKKLIEERNPEDDRIESRELNLQETGMDK